jgi:hypothetical protein
MAELRAEIVLLQAELKRVQEELIVATGIRNRLEGELEGFQKCFKLINEMGPQEEESDDDELH